MSAPLLLSPLLVPLIVALLAVHARTRRLVEHLMPWAPVPALLVALGAPVGTRADLPWLFLGSAIVLDEIGRLFLLFSGIVWSLASIHARGHLARDPRRATFHAFLLLAMAGNLGLPLADDVPLFYACFVLTTFSAYGIVVHRRSDSAVRAATIYIVLAVIGEAMLLSGVLLTAGSMQTLLVGEAPSAVARSPHTELIVVLLLGGFGVKAALLPLHVWLPLAHPVAPVPGSAVLSGAMIKAGLLGWLRFLPLGTLAPAHLGLVAMMAGLVGAYYGALVGLTQRDPKTILAYSSVSQMGLMLVIVGSGLAGASRTESASAAGLFALHHGIAKASLFLSVTIIGPWLRGWLRRLAALGIALPVAALAGAPATSGAIAKKALEHSVHASGMPVFELAAAFASALTLVLLLRFAATLRDRAGPATRPSGWALGAWLGSVVFTLALVWWLPWSPVPHFVAQSLSGPALGSATWPIILGLALFTFAHTIAEHLPLRLPRIPPGDLLAPAERAWRTLHRTLTSNSHTPAPPHRASPTPGRGVSPRGRAAGVSSGRSGGRGRG